MNRYTRLVLKGFQSKSNRESLQVALVNTFNDTKVYNYVNSNIESLVDNFAKAYEIEMMNSDPIIGLTVNEQINILNNEFIEDKIRFIKTHLLGDQETPETFVIRDGGPATSRNSLKHFQSAPDDILASWKKNSGRGMVSREDVQADTYSENPYYFSSSDGMHTGIAVCDQSNIGTSQHVDSLYNDKNFRILNGLDKGGKLWGGHFGDGSAEEDARLLNRRIFRSNEQGIENGIPVYEQRLYRRNLERDAAESLAGRERESNVYRHDMQSLRDRVDQRRQWTDQHKYMNQYS